MVALARSDPAMARVIAQVGPLSLDKRRRGRARSDAYGALLRAIVGQQLSTKAAATIFARVTAHFGDRVPGPEELLELDPQLLREAGLSGRKTEYVRDLALHVLDGTLDVDRLPDMPDDEVIAELTAVRGLGLWTAQMFLMFHLSRPDVLPAGDLGIRQAIKLSHGLDETPPPAEVERIGAPWAPNRTLASLYLWELLDNKPA
jgi:DNA-3-methyladenine glycosylase II